MSPRPVVAHPHGTPAHKAARRWYVSRYVPGRTRCAIGGEVLTQPGRQLDLAHSDDGRSYLGLACHRHNRGPGRLPGSRKTGRIGSRVVPKTSTIAATANDDNDREQQRRERSTQHERERAKIIDERERERRARRVIIVPGDGSRS